MLNSLDFFPKARVLVLGDVMLDQYWQGETSRISPEAPVPVVHIQSQTKRLGGAGNVAVNIRALGADVEFLGVCGKDEAGREIAEQLSGQGVAHQLQSHADNKTVTKLRVLSRHQQLVRLDFEEAYLHSDQESLIKEFKQALCDSGAIILSDYGKGTIVDPQSYIQAARSANIPVLIDPKGKDFARYRGATLLTPNQKEFEVVMGECRDEMELVEKGFQAIRENDLAALLITRGAQGMTLLQREQPPLHLSAKARDVYDVTGAGDTVIALLAAGLAAGIPLAEATRLANIGASITVAQIGAASVSIPQLRRAIQTLEGGYSGMMTEVQLKTAVADARAHGERIVMTNGCFDILHAGHVNYLEKAKALGDRLIVAVNDDESVKRLKGSKRPINALAQRMSILASLESVDWVVPFSEDTPLRLINEILPDVLVKGGDYTVEEVVGAEVVMAQGGEVKIIDFVPGFSTTKIIAEIAEEAS